MDALLAELPGEVVSYDAQHAADLTGLAHEIETWPEYVRNALARAWPDPEVLPTPGQVRRGEAAWTVDNLDFLRVLFTNAEAPFNIWTEPQQELRSRAFATGPAPHPDEAPCDMETLQVLLDTVKGAEALVPQINEWLTEGHEAGHPWSPVKMPNVRNYERLRCAYFMANLGVDTDLAWELVCPGEPIIGTVGEAIGCLSSAAAQAVTQRVDDLTAGRSILLYGPEGKPSVVPAISVPDQG